MIKELVAELGKRKEIPQPITASQEVFERIQPSKRTPLNDLTFTRSIFRVP